MVDPVEVEMDEDEFCDYLNEVWDDVRVCGYDMQSGSVLREMDPIAFRCALSEQESQWKCGHCDTEHEELEDARECCERETNK